MENCIRCTFQFVGAGLLSAHFTAELDQLLGQGCVSIDNMHLRALCQFEQYKVLSR